MAAQTVIAFATETLLALTDCRVPTPVNSTLHNTTIFQVTRMFSLITVFSSQSEASWCKDGYEAPSASSSSGTAGGACAMVGCTDC